MPSWLPSIAYPPPNQPGYWDPVTATLTWCEEPYWLTSYSAEFMNTMTNLMYFFSAYKGIKSCRRNAHDSIFTIAYYGYLAVGFGSFMFHTTRKYGWQLVDELNMIYTTALMIYASHSHKKSQKFKVGLGLGLVVFCLSVTGYYHWCKDPTFHQNVYAAMTIWLVGRCVMQMEASLRPSWRGSTEPERQAREKRGELVPSRKEQERVNQRDLAILSTMWFMVVWGVSVFLTGFAIWGIDNVFCSDLRRWRRAIGLPWGVLLEGHAWWHILTGYGAYCYIVWGIHLRHILNGDQDQFELLWTRMWRLPEILRKKRSYANGSAAKIS